MCTSNLVVLFLSPREYEVNIIVNKANIRLQLLCDKRQLLVSGNFNYEVAT